MSPAEEVYPAQSGPLPPQTQGVPVPPIPRQPQPHPYPPYGYAGPQSTQQPHSLGQPPGSYSYSPSSSPVPFAAPTMYGNASPGTHMFAPSYAAAHDNSRSSSPEKAPAGLVPGGLVVHAVAQPPEDHRKCACTSGWIMFGLGFLLPILWFVSFFIACCVRNKHNRNAAIALAVMVIVIGTLLGVLLGLYFAPGNCRDLGYGISVCYNSFSGICRYTMPFVGTTREYCGASAFAQATANNIYNSNSFVGH